MSIPRIPMGRPDQSLRLAEGHRGADREGAGDLGDAIVQVRFFDDTGDQAQTEGLAGGEHATGQSEFPYPLRSYCAGSR